MTRQRTDVLGINLDDARLAELLDGLDRSEAAKSEGKNRRTESRFQFRRRGIIVEFRRSEGTCAMFNVATRNLSRNGVNFLITGFVHKGTPCRVRLVAPDNNSEIVSGEVRWCRFVQGRIHEVGMRFEQTLDVQSFCAEAVALRMLVVDNDPLIRRLVRHHLEKLGVAVKAVEDGRKGVDEALAGLYDCVLMDVDMPVLDGIAALAELRKRGYCGLVIAATAVSGPENEERIRTAGFDECVKKPLTPESLNELLDRFSDDPICSTLARQPGMAGMINAFVDGLATSCREIEKALVESDFKLLGRIARQIKADTGSLGFEAVSEASGKLEELAHAGADPDAVRTQLRVLLQLCTRVRPAHD